MENADPDVIRTRSLLIWSQTRYHCATESPTTSLPLAVKLSGDSLRSGVRVCFNLFFFLRGEVKLSCGKGELFSLLIQLQ